MGTTKNYFVGVGVPLMSHGACRCQPELIGVILREGGEEQHTPHAELLSEGGGVFLEGW